MWKKDITWRKERKLGKGLKIYDSPTKLIYLSPPPNPSHLTQYWWRGVGGLGHSNLNLGKVGSIFFGKGALKYAC